MLNLKQRIPDIEKYPIMKILAAGKSIKKYNLDHIQKQDAFLIIVNYIDIVSGLSRIEDVPILVFAHDYEIVDHPAKEPQSKLFFQKSNVYLLLHHRELSRFYKSGNDYSEIKVVEYSDESISHVRNLILYEKAQNNYRHFEKTDNSLMGLSSTVHSPISLVVGNDFIQEMQIYGLDVYIYQELLKYNNINFMGDSRIVNKHNRSLMNYIRRKRQSLRIVFNN